MGITLVLSSLPSNAYLSKLLLVLLACLPVKAAQIGRVS